MPDQIANLSRETIAKGSTSFAAAARLFDPATRDDASMLYAWCRHCDDEIDGQVLGHGQIGIDPAKATAKLQILKDKTRAALAGNSMGDDPSFEAFQRVALRYAIPEAYPLDLLEGFRMDVEEIRYETLEDVLLYAHRVAGVVGVMMAMIMGVRDLPTLRRAADLGLGLQLTNIARDVIEDAKGDRVYLPEAWLREAGLGRRDLTDPARRDAIFAVTQRLLEAAEPYYESARWGLAHLPLRSAWAIAAARSVYHRIGVEVVRKGPDGMTGRARVSTPAKLALILQGGLVAARAKTIDRFRAAPDRPALWSAI